MQVGHPLYQQDLESVAQYIMNIPDHSSVLVTGATGLIGSFLVDALMYYNQTRGKSIQIKASGRRFAKLQERFSCWKGYNTLQLIERDAVEEIPEDEEYDYMIHLASNADPRSYALYPAETIITNVIGTMHVLNYAKAHQETKILFASTFEVYGSVPGAEAFQETQYGAVDFNQVRSGYPESKRTAELLIRSYVEEYGVYAVIARLSSIYGPTMTTADNKAAAQFIRKAAAKQDIVLKSKGEQRRSYCYVADAAAGILTALCLGQAGEAYNVCNPSCTITIADLAKIAAKAAGTEVIYDLPDELERRGFSKSQDSVLSADKLVDLGFSPVYSAEDGVGRTVEIIG